MRERTGRAVGIGYERSSHDLAAPLPRSALFAELDLDLSRGGNGWRSLAGAAPALVRGGDGLASRLRPDTMRTVLGALTGAMFTFIGFVCSSLPLPTLA